MKNRLEISEECIIDEIETEPQYTSRVDNLKDDIQKKEDVKRKEELGIVIVKLLTKRLKIKINLIEEYNKLTDYYSKF